MHSSPRLPAPSGIARRPPSPETACSEGPQSAAFTSSSALDGFTIRCPNCAHRFTLSDGLLMGEKLEAGDEEGAAALSLGDDTAHGSMESLTMAGAPACSGNGALLNLQVSGSFNAAAATAPDDDGDGEAEPGAPAGAASAEDSKTSQPVVRCYQIVNWTVEDLEKVICDPKDRRIRKISTISHCDIEVRSEMPVTKFGAPKNLCILRAAQAVNIEQCRGLLKRQLFLILKPRPQEAETNPATER